MKEKLVADFPPVKEILKSRRLFLDDNDVKKYEEMLKSALNEFPKAYTDPYESIMLHEKFFPIMEEIIQEIKEKIKKPIDKNQFETRIEILQHLSKALLYTGKVDSNHNAQSLIISFIFNRVFPDVVLPCFPVCKKESDAEAMHYDFSNLDIISRNELLILKEVSNKILGDKYKNEKGIDLTPKNYGLLSEILSSKFFLFYLKKEVFKDANSAGKKKNREKNVSELLRKIKEEYTEERNDKLFREIQSKIRTSVVQFVELKLSDLGGCSIVLERGDSCLAGFAEFNAIAFPRDEDLNSYNQRLLKFEDNLPFSINDVGDTQLVIDPNAVMFPFILDKFSGELATLSGIPMNTIAKFEQNKWLYEYFRYKILKMFESFIFRSDEERRYSDVNIGYLDHGETRRKDEPIHFPKRRIDVPSESIKVNHGEDGSPKSIHLRMLHGKKPSVNSIIKAKKEFEIENITDIETKEQILDIYSTEALIYHSKKENIGITADFLKSEGIELLVEFIRNQCAEVLEDEELDYKEIDSITELINTKCSSCLNGFINNGEIEISSDLLNSFSENVKTPAVINIMRSYLCQRLAGVVEFAVAGSHQDEKRPAVVKDI